MKKALAWIISLALIAGAIGGGIYAYNRSAAENRTVEVTPVSWLYTTYWGDETQSSGMISTGMTQTITPEDEQIIQEIFVSEGDPVKVGTPILQYDTTLIQLELELKQMSLQNMDNKILNAAQQLAELRKIRPVTTLSRIADGLSLMTADASDPADEVDPGNTPAPSDPDDPTAPDESSQPTEPDDPTEPTDPSTPTDPENPSDSENPSDPADPAEPTEPSQPDDPTTPTEPTDPAEPTEPTDPAEPTKPDEPEPETLIKDESLTPDAPHTGTGTENDPRIYCCLMDVKITPEFVADLISEQIIVELHLYRSEEDFDKDHPKQTDPDDTNSGDDDSNEEASEPDNANESANPDEPVNPDKPNADEPNADDPNTDDPNTDDPGEEAPRFYYTLHLDGSGIYKILNPEPDEPEEPTDDPGLIDDPGFMDDPGFFGDPGPTGPTYTRAELAKMIADKEDEITKLNLDKRSAELELRTIERKLENATVLSTVNGVVKTLKDESEAKLDGSPMIELSASSGYYATGTISELMLEQLSAGDTVTLMSYETGMSYDATITSISDVPTSGNYYYGGAENPNVSYYEFTAAVDDSADLRNGEYVGITISAPDTSAGEGMYIDKSYIRTENGVSYVYKVSEDSRLVKQVVETGKTLWDSYIEVKSGITLDDFLAFPYGKYVKEGTKAVTEDGLPAVPGSMDDMGGMFGFPEDFDMDGMEMPVEGDDEFLIEDIEDDSPDEDDENTDGEEAGLEDNGGAPEEYDSDAAAE